MKPIICIMICTALAVSLYAKTVTKLKPRIILVEAYSQRTLPGVRRATAPPATTHIIAVWESRQHADVFFWRADTSLLLCRVLKAHKMVNKPHNVPPGVDYSTENIAAENINKGDTLDIVPVPGNAGNVPAGIPATGDTKNVLFFKTKEGGWATFHVDTIKRKRDIAMP